MSTLPATSHRLAQAGSLHEPAYGELLDQLPLALLMVDEEPRVRYWNRGLENLSGRSRADMLGSRWGTNFFVEIPPPDAPQLHMPSTFLRHQLGHLLPVQQQALPMPGRLVREAGRLLLLTDTTPSMALLEHARQSPELELLDTLSGLGNRRLAKLELEAFIIRYHLHRRSFGLVLFDVDLFHQVNARFGYDCSDCALQVVARSLHGCLHPHDLLCRWSGDEFLALVVGDCPGVHAKAELCRTAVEWSSMDWMGEPVPLTVSAGVEMVMMGERPEDIVGRAAFRLRMSKRLGRNLVSGCANPQAE